MGPPAAELIEAGFELENADAPVLHHGMNLAASLAPGFDPESDQAWKHCPILDRNGFGEIIVNPPWLQNAVPDVPAQLPEESDERI